MFTSSNSTNNHTDNSNHTSSSYAFAQSNTNAANSSAAIKRQDQAHIYQPLPPRASTSSDGPRSPPTSPRGNVRNSYNPRYDPPPRTPSPPATNPLLAGASPITGESPSMPPQRYQSRGAVTSMPQRGESQSALLPERQQSTGRRYGPTASSISAGPGSALLNSPSTSSDKHGLEGGSWGGFDNNNPESDDYLHNPDPRGGRRSDRGTIFTIRGFLNIGCLALLIVILLTLFAGYPIITHYTDVPLSTNGGYNLGGINSTGQVPLISNFPTPIDPDTPQSVQTRTGFDGKQYNLVFSDEFNKDGRTFFPGDDAYWTAVDLHYWPTGDFEWYDPSAVTTKDGHLVITMDQQPIHNLNFKSGMVQSWNQMCFQYSFYIEVSCSLPGTPAVGGFWPGIWTMGNLGRPGYGATTEGTWPYTYSSCDIGTLPNQTNVAQTAPAAALDTGSNGGSLSYLPGQRLSACTCPGGDHPGPSVTVGRSSPEIDALEAQTDLALNGGTGQVSQSFQVAPFDDYYQPANGSSDVTQYDPEISMWNTYKGGEFQQAVSTLTYIDGDNYALTSGGFGVYGFEMFSDPNDRGAGYINWMANGKQSWTMHASAVGPNPVTEIGQRLIPEEPMAMILNFGMSNNFQTVNFDSLTWPAEMRIDYVRVYQTDAGKMGCDPSDRPTAEYIANHANAYSNPNLTTWEAAGYTFPKNSLVGC